MIAVIVAVGDRYKRSSLAQRFLGGAVWSVFGSVMSSAITLVMLMLVARVLGKEIYGQFVVIQSTLSMLGVFAGFGIGSAATRYAAELKARDTVRLGHILTLAELTILCFGLLASTGLVFAGGWMASHLLNAPGLSLPLAISACAVLFSAMDSYQKSVLIGFESIRAFAIGTVIGAVAGFPIMLIAATHFGLLGAALAMVVNSLLQASISRYQMIRLLQKNRVRRISRGCLSEWPVLWRFAFPALLTSALVVPAHWGAQAMLANTPHGYGELAVLGIAMQWFNVIMFVPTAAGRVVLPILTDYVAQNDRGSSRKILLYAATANAIVAIPLAIVVATLSPYIMRSYGVSFNGDTFPLILAVMIAMFLAIQTPIGNLLAASSRMWVGVWMNAGWATIYLGATFFLVERGASGVIIALLIGYSAHAIWTFWFAFHYIKK